MQCFYVMRVLYSVFFDFTAGLDRAEAAVARAQEERVRFWAELEESQFHLEAL